MNDNDDDTIDAFQQTGSVLRMGILCESSIPMEEALEIEPIESVKLTSLIVGGEPLQFATAYQPNILVTLSCDREVIDACQSKFTYKDNDCLL